MCICTCLGVQLFSAAALSGGATSTASATCIVSASGAIINGPWEREGEVFGCSGWKESATLSAKPWPPKRKGILWLVLLNIYYVADVEWQDEYLSIFTANLGGNSCFSALLYHCVSRVCWTCYLIGSASLLLLTFLSWRQLYSSNLHVVLHHWLTASCLKNNWTLSSKCVYRSIFLVRTCGFLAYMTWHDMTWHDRIFLWAVCNTTSIKTIE